MNPFTCFTVPLMFTVSQGLFLFMPYIVSTIIKGHREAANALAAKLESTCLSSFFDVYINYVFKED